MLMNVPPIPMKSSLLAALCLTTAFNLRAWETLPSMPEPNSGFVVGATHGMVVVAGGTNWEGGQKHWLANVHMFNPQKMLWTTPYMLESPMGYGVGGTAA